MDWVWVESPGTALNEEPRVISSKFGDGYEQRAPDGLNPTAQSWPLTFNEVDSATADEMMAFLRTANAVTAFNYVPLWSTAPIRVICRKWSRTHLGFDRNSIAATFEQVFEP